MQFQVPQFIETEDKVVGPMSLRQFFYIGGGALLCAMIYFMVSTWLFLIFTFIVMAITLSIAFVKVNGQPFIKIAAAAIGYYWSPRAYLWKQEVKQESQPAPAPVEAPKESAFSLEKIAAGMALHKSWENLQTGTKPQKSSDREFVEKKMNDRYQIFQRVSGERDAARRVDYR